MDPTSLKFTKTHEWTHLADGVATVGITEFAVKALTDLVYVDLPEKGRSLKAGDIFGEVESVKAVSDLKCPVTGEVVDVNVSLSDDLDALSEDPFGRGWLIKLETIDDATLSHLLDLAAYEAHCASESH